MGSIGTTSSWKFIGEHDARRQKNCHTKVKLHVRFTSISIYIIFLKTLSVDTL